MFDTLIDIADDLENGHQGNISDTIENLNEAYENILAIQFDMGYEYKRIEQAEQYSSDQAFRLEAIISETTDIDYSEAISSLALQQTAYEASLATSTRIMKMSLLNYI